MRFDWISLTNQGAPEYLLFTSNVINTSFAAEFLQIIMKREVRQTLILRLHKGICMDKNVKCRNLCLVLLQDFVVETW